MTSTPDIAGVRGQGAKHRRDELGRDQQPTRLPPTSTPLSSQCPREMSRRQNALPLAPRVQTRPNARFASPGHPYIRTEAPRGVREGVTPHAPCRPRQRHVSAGQPGEP